MPSSMCLESMDFSSVLNSIHSPDMSVFRVEIVGFKDVQSLQICSHLLEMVAPEKEGPAAGNYEPSSTSATAIAAYPGSTLRYHPEMFVAIPSMVVG